MLRSRHNHRTWRKKQHAVLLRRRRRGAFRRLFAEELERRVLLTTAISVAPTANSHTAAPSTDISATFDRDIDPVTATHENFVVHSLQRPGAISVTANRGTVAADPTPDFFPGEVVQVTATSGLRSTEADSVVPRVWQFRTAATGGTGVFQADQTFDTGGNRVELGDVDGDGDLDAAARLGGVTRLWLNDGDGRFVDSGQTFEAVEGSIRGVVFGDLDGDGDLDAFAFRSGGDDRANRVWLNDGSGQFTDSGQRLGSHTSWWATLGDLDSDGDLDAFVSNYSLNQPSRVWLNDGAGNFSDTGQTLGTGLSTRAELGDLDGDGDLDAFVSSGGPDLIWMNDGGAVFTLGMQLDNQRSYAAVLADLDNDGDLDAVSDGLQSTYFNDGNGNFAARQHLVLNGTVMETRAGDLDSDGDVDLVMAVRDGDASRAWINDGTGFFAPGHAFSQPSAILLDMALVDLDGDNDLDVFFTAGANATSGVWLNQNRPIQVTLSAGSPSLAEASGSTTIIATLSSTAPDPVTIDLNVGGSATSGGDYTISATQIVVPTGESSSEITITAVQDVLDEADETVAVDIKAVTNGEIAGGSQQVTITIIDDDDPPTVDLSVDRTNIGEAAGVATATATLSVVSGRDVTVDLTAGGTATLGTDYNLSASQIVIPAGETTGTAALTAIDDPIDEPDETVELSLTATNATVGVASQSLTIIDDDDPPTVSLTVDNATITEDGGVATFTATLSAPALAAVTVDLAFSGSATESVDYTISGSQIVIPAGATSASITVTSVADMLITEDSETVVVDIAVVSANATEDGVQQAITTILNDVNGPEVTLSVDNATLAENGGVATFTATLASAFSLPVTVDLAFGGTAASGDDYAASGTQILVPAGSTTGAITITGVDDLLIEGDETVIVEITSVLNGKEAESQQRTATIVDDEAPPLVTLAVDNATIPEAGGVATFTATLSAVSTIDVTVELDFAGTATAPDDYIRSGTQIVIPAGIATGTVTVTSFEETTDDGDETVVVGISRVINGTEDGSQQQTTTIIDDDETPPGPTPAGGTHNANARTKVRFNFEQTLTTSSVTEQTFVVHGTAGRGQLVGTATTVSAAGSVAVHEPTNSFFAGEWVQATVTSGITTTSGPATPRVWQFRTASGGSGEFEDGGIVLGQHAFGTVSLGDIDDDGDLDAVHGGTLSWLNDGAGGFTDSGRNLGGELGELEFADVDGDGDLDIAGSRVMLNDGSGMFTDSGVSPAGDQTRTGDLDGDGDLDIMSGVRYAPNRVWLNNGSGQLFDTGQALGNSSTDANELGDFDNDGDLDAVEAVNGAPNRIWLNDGNGVFSDTGQALGGFRATKDVDVGDVDGDGDLDVVTGNVYSNDGARVWINNGSAIFTESGQVIGGDTAQIYRVRIGDMDGDNDLDVVAFQRFGAGTEIWLNDGSGNFADSGQRLVFTGGARRIDYADIGDLDGDGDLDLLEANVRSDGPGSRIWFNRNLTPNVTLGIDNPTIPEAAGTATVTATLSAAHTSPVTVNLSLSGTATATEDYTVSGTQIVVPVGSTTGSVTITAVQDTRDEPDETVIVEIASITNGQGSGQTSATILDDDEPPVPDVTLSLDNVAIPEDGGVATFTVNLSEATTVPVTVDLAVSGTATLTADYTLSATRIVVAAGSTSGSVTVTAMQDTLEEPHETVIVDIANVMGGNESGTQRQTTTITDDDAPATPRVSSLTGTSSGFVAVFNSDLDTSTLNLYDTRASGLGAADATLVGTSSGSVSGSLVVDAAARSVTFIKTGTPLAADTYTVTLRSAENGFKRTDGLLLDGDGDGTPGGDFTETFTVAPAAANAVTVSLPDFVRGPGQEVNLPADATTGIPLLISEGPNLRNAALQIDYDPRMLAISAATVGSAMPAGATVTLDTATAGTAILTFTSPAALPAGSHVLVNLQASIPAANASAIYGQQQVLDVHSVQLTDANANPIPAVVDDALHLVTYFADVSGNGRINASDASQVARFAALLETGFAGSLSTDPIIVGDISGNGRINAADASLLAQFAAFIPVPEIPPIPGGVVVAGSGGRDGIGSQVLLHHKQTGKDEEEDSRTALSTTGAAGAGTTVYYPALDAVMAELAVPRTRSLDVLDSASSLDDTLDELLSVFTQSELPGIH